MLWRSQLLVTTNRPVRATQLRHIFGRENIVLRKAVLFAAGAFHVLRRPHPERNPGVAAGGSLNPSDGAMAGGAAGYGTTTSAAAEVQAGTPIFMLHGVGMGMLPYINFFR